MGNNPKFQFIVNLMPLSLAHNTSWNDRMAVNEFGWNVGGRGHGIIRCTAPRFA
jgi:hypothetical protein